MAKEVKRATIAKTKTKAKPKAKPKAKAKTTAPKTIKEKVVKVKESPKPKEVPKVKEAPKKTTKKPVVEAEIIELKQEVVVEPKKRGRKRTRPEKPKRVDPLYGEDGKAYCPVCKERRWESLDYNTTDVPGIFRFKVFCKECFVVFEYEKGI